MRRQFALFLVATQFLTRLPAAGSRNCPPLSLSQSARYFPLVGGLVGAINVGVWWVLERWLPPAVAIGCMLVTSLLVTGALHEDGLADACDGFGGGTTPERVLCIMKDSRIGAFGAIGLLMTLGLKWTTLASLPSAALPLLVVAAHVVSRWCAIGLIWRLPYVREDVNAKSRPFAGTLSAAGWTSSGAIGLAAIAPFAYAGSHFWNLHAAPVICATALAALAALGAAAYFNRRIGGYTGDCLGAVQQLSELVFLIGGLAAVNATRT